MKHKPLISLFSKRREWCQVCCRSFLWGTQNAFWIQLENIVGHCLKNSPRRFVVLHWILLPLCKDFIKNKKNPTFCFKWINSMSKYLQAYSTAIRIIRQGENIFKESPSEGNVIHFKVLLVCLLMWSKKKCATWRPIRLYLLRVGIKDLCVSVKMSVTKVGITGSWSMLGCQPGPTQKVAFNMLCWSKCPRAGHPIVMSHVLSLGSDLWCL